MYNKYYQITNSYLKLTNNNAPSVTNLEFSGTYVKLSDERQLKHMDAQEINHVVFNTTGSYYVYSTNSGLWKSYNVNESVLGIPGFDGVVVYKTKIIDGVYYVCADTGVYSTTDFGLFSPTNFSQSAKDYYKFLLMELIITSEGIYQCFNGGLSTKISDTYDVNFITESSYIHDPDGAEAGDDQCKFVLFGTTDNGIKIVRLSFMFNGDIKNGSYIYRGNGLVVPLTGISETSTYYGCYDDSSYSGFRIMCGNGEISNVVMDGALFVTAVHSHPGINVRDCIRLNDILYFTTDNGLYTSTDYGKTLVKYEYSMKFNGSLTNIYLLNSVQSTITIIPNYDNSKGYLYNDYLLAVKEGGGHILMFIKDDIVYEITEIEPTSYTERLSTIIQESNIFDKFITSGQSLYDNIQGYSFSDILDYKIDKFYENDFYLYYYVYFNIAGNKLVRLYKFTKFKYVNDDYCIVDMPDYLYSVINNKTFVNIAVKEQENSFYLILKDDSNIYTVQLKFMDFDRPESVLIDYSVITTSNYNIQHNDAFNYYGNYLYIDKENFINISNPLRKNLYVNDVVSDSKLQVLFSDSEEVLYKKTTTDNREIEIFFDKIITVNLEMNIKIPSATDTIIGASIGKIYTTDTYYLAFDDYFSHTEWQSSKLYNEYEIIKIDDTYYRCIYSHTSSTLFSSDSHMWERVYSNNWYKFSYNFTTNYVKLVFQNIGEEYLIRNIKINEIDSITRYINNEAELRNLASISGFLTSPKKYNTLISDESSIIRVMDIFKKDNNQYLVAWGESYEDVLYVKNPNNNLWTKSNAIGLTSTVATAVDYLYDEILLGTADKGLFMTSDDGNSWNNIKLWYINETKYDASSEKINVVHSDPLHMFALIGTDTGLYKYQRGNVYADFYYTIKGPVNAIYERDGIYYIGTDNGLYKITREETSIDRALPYSIVNSIYSYGRTLYVSIDNILYYKDIEGILYNQIEFEDTIIDVLKYGDSGKIMIGTRNSKLYIMDAYSFEITEYTYNSDLYNPIITKIRNIDGVIYLMDYTKNINYMTEQSYKLTTEALTPDILTYVEEDTNKVNVILADDKFLCQANNKMYLIEADLSNISSTELKIEQINKEYDFYADLDLSSYVSDIYGTNIPVFKNAEGSKYIYYKYDNTTYSDWVSGNAYTSNNVVKYNNLCYKCILNTQAPHTELPTNATYWEEYDRENTYIAFPINTDEYVVPVLNYSDIKTYSTLQNDFIITYSNRTGQFKLVVYEGSEKFVVIPFEYRAGAFDIAVNLLNNANSNGILDNVANRSDINSLLIGLKLEADHTLVYNKVGINNDVVVSENEIYNTAINYNQVDLLNTLEIKDFTKTASWNRTGTVVTITSTTHGMQTGDIITITQSSNLTSIALNSYKITRTGNNAFTIIGVNSGASSGTLSYNKTYISDPLELSIIYKGESENYASN